MESKLAGMNCRSLCLQTVFKNLALTCGLLGCACANAGNLATTSPNSLADAPQLLEVYTLPRTSLEVFAPTNLHYDLEAAQKAGLKFTNLPSIGSGLAQRADGALFGITDRGPNGESTKYQRVFPLPDFCPAIAQLELTNHAIQLRQILPLTGTHGEPLTGLSNGKGEETTFASPNGTDQLAFDPSGVDTESIRCLPGGGFVLSEEYSPSLLVVDSRGKVLTRYTPVSKPLVGAHYPVQPILPDIFIHRRINRGFESVALSKDGRTLYAVLQSSMGGKKDPRYANSQLIRVLEMDFSDPLRAKVSGMFLFPASKFSDYPRAKKQDNIKICDAEWLAPQRLLVLEHGPGEAKLRVADLSHASNILNAPSAGSLHFEDVNTDLAALHIHPAKMTTVLNTRSIPEIDTDKLEGLALLGPDKIALSNDNDFGIGQNVNGEPSRIWVVRVPAIARFKP